MSEGATDRPELSRQEFNDLLTFEESGKSVGTVDLVIRDDNDLLICANRRKDENSCWRIVRYRVLGDGVSFSSEELDRVNVAAVIVEEFDAEALTTDERHATRKVRYGVPTVVAVDGKPAICAWLYAAQERPRSEIADLMNVGEPTVREYLSRFRQRATGIPDGVDIPEVGEHVPEIPHQFDAVRQQIVTDGGRSGEGVTEHDIWLSQHDMDHLNGGQPVFKGIGEDTRLVIRPVQPTSGQSRGADDGK